MDINIDFGNCPLSGVFYGGNEKKLGILFDDERYMLKFRKNTPLEKRNNHISEYLGSHIFGLLGIKSQKTVLGFYKGEKVTACRDFLPDGYQYVPFYDLSESMLEGDGSLFSYTYENILVLLEKSRKLTDVKETASSFFDVYIIDALLGNFDRHGANWGFLKKDNKYILAPVFDNGSCLFPQMIDEDMMRKILSSEEEINKRVYTFPTSQIKLKDKKSSYFEVISSLAFEECNQALKRIYPRIDLTKIDHLIDPLPISDIHREFYKTMIRERYEKILKYSYEKECKKEHE